MNFYYFALFLSDDFFHYDDAIIGNFASTTNVGENGKLLNIGLSTITQTCESKLIKFAKITPMFFRFLDPLWSTDYLRHFDKEIHKLDAMDLV